MAISNVDLWNKIRAAYPNFRNHTSEGTKELFTEAGFERLQNYSIETLNDFFDLSIRVFLQSIDVAKSKDDFDDSGFGEVYEQARGGYLQRMAIKPMPPISPKYKGLVNGKSVDPYTVRKPEVEERFFKQNFDFQNLVTIADEFAFKQIFISEYGMNELFSGILLQMDNSYITQKYVNKLEAINSGINSSTNPLQDSQIITTNMKASPDEDDYIELIRTIKNTIRAMTRGSSTSAFNAMHYPSVQKKDRLKLLIRPGYQTDIELLVARNSFNASTLDIGIDIIEVENFGGLMPYKDEDFSTVLYEVYDEFGAVKGYSTTKNSGTVEVEKVDVFWKDPNEDVVAIIADKGWIFHTTQNAYRSEAIRNPAGLYTNWWVSCPNGGIFVDSLYNVAVIKKTAAAA